MGDGVNTEENKTSKMGASSNSNAARLVALQERKQNIEETLAKRNEELRQLCIQEAELTGTMPTEIPLEPGESPSVFRRRVDTAFQLPQNLIDNLSNEEESMSSLELNMRLQANMAEAALGLANETNISKTIRRQYMTQYQYHKRQFNGLEEKLSFFKARNQMAQQSPLTPDHQHQKQKKKPRPAEQDDTVSMNVNMQQSEPFAKSVLRHSMRSLQHPMTSDGVEHRTLSGHQKLAYRNSEGNYRNSEANYRNSEGSTYRNSEGGSYRSSEGSPHTDHGSPLIRPEDSVMSGIYRLSLNGYKAYMDRKESHIITNQHIPHYVSSHSNPNLYQHQSSPLQYAQLATHTLPHGAQRTSHGYVMYSHHQYSPTMHDYAKYNHGSNGYRLSSSPGSTSHSSSYSKGYYTVYPNSRQYPEQFRTLNPHQIQPHQQYEHDVMTAGLGGYWKKTESGELVWCSSAQSDSWQRDKRFGSLDRRRNKRVHKRTSPSVDPKSATISVVMPYPESVRPVPAKPQQIGIRNRQDNRQLVRTQSLGSVGAQTVDSVWPSDDNSSCGSDAHSINEANLAARKHKQKEWFETSLDGPAPLTPTRSHSTVSSTVPSTVPSISPEEKYVETTSPQPLSSPQPHKALLEIPAESNPNQSPTVPEPNMELFNNNIPKNGTLIQAGHCKPYHEETKPFEMSDFYKYSTKFKKSPVKQTEGKHDSVGMSPLAQRSLNQSFEEDASVIQKGIYQPLQPMKCQPFSPNNNCDRAMGSPSSANTSLDLSQLTSNVAENFSAEMNAWYKNHEQQIDNNNARQGANSRSTATLV